MSIPNLNSVKRSLLHYAYAGAQAATIATDRGNLGQEILG